MFPGKDRENLRNCLSRAFGHGAMKQVAQQFSKDKVSSKLGPGLNGRRLQPELIGVAAAFVNLQQARHEADYNTGRRFTRREVLDLVEQVELAFAGWEQVSRSVQADTFLAGLIAFESMRG